MVGIRCIPLPTASLEFPLTGSEAIVNVHVYQAPENISLKFHTRVGTWLSPRNACHWVKQPPYNKLKGAVSAPRTLIFMH